eukprot:TRINITY_DN2040_c1_g1_i3.p1 TRINITY_DN2040_c1_g1~~TRINITY_DN2040_c1_g1_i3.p1  ORF type:complete len:395 (+),score=44.01 TRINITY_DN2040_c1_g1_i3:998-2182(+)
MGGLSLYISREELSFFCHNSLRWLKSPHKKLRYASCELISGLCSRDWQCLEVTEDNFCHCFETVVSLSMEQIEHRHTTHPDLRVFLNCLGDMSQCSQFIVALDSFLVALGELLVHILDIFPGSLDFRYPKDIVNTAFWTTGQFASSLEKAKIACKIDSSVTHTLKKIYAMFEKFDFSIDKNIPRIIGNLGMTLCQIHRANNLDLERNPIFLNLCDLFAKHLEGPSFDEKSNLPITSNVIHILENLFLGFSDVIPLEKKICFVNQLSKVLESSQYFKLKRLAAKTMGAIVSLAENEKIVDNVSMFSILLSQMCSKRKIMKCLSTQSLPSISMAFETEALTLAILLVQHSDHHAVLEMKRRFLGNENGEWNYRLDNILSTKNRDLFGELRDLFKKY